TTVLCFLTNYHVADKAAYATLHVEEMHHHAIKKRFYLNNPHNIVVIIVLELIDCYIILLPEDL
ncbi:hypothetical protein ACJX0J_023343, partial [Zea mays]